MAQVYSSQKPRSKIFKKIFFFFPTFFHTQKSFMKNQQTKLNESSTRQRGFTVSQKSQMGKIKFKEKNILKKKKRKLKNTWPQTLPQISSLFLEQ